MVHRHRAHRRHPQPRRAIRRRLRARAVLAGARTAWHTRPKGQTLYVTDGIGDVARRGGEPQEIRPGDVVYIEPGEGHWHDATPDRFMAHVAIQEADENGEVVTWGEHVTDEEQAA